MLRAMHLLARLDLSSTAKILVIKFKLSLRAFQIPFAKMNTQHVTGPPVLFHNFLAPRHGVQSYFTALA